MNPLVNFWGQIQSDGMLLRDELVKLKNLHPNPDRAKDLFLFSKEKVNDLERSSLIRAVAFYVVNKCSFSGLTESSSFSKQASESNFSMRGIDRIPGYSLIIKNWKITNLSYDELLTDDPEVFTYLDPPYDIKDNLYGNKGDMHKRFDHDKFAIDCDQCNGHQLISYNSSQLVKDRFKNWKASEFDLTYTMRSVGQYMQEQQDRKELVLMNF